MPAIKIGPKHQITIPKEVFDSLHLEVGDFLDTHIKDNAIILVPKKLVPKDQEWFWTKEWQEMEKEADEAIGLPEDIQELIHKQIIHLPDNPKHPSLRLKKMEGHKSIYEVRITKGYRMTLQIVDDIYLLRRVGTHSILKKLTFVLNLSPYVCHSAFVSKTYIEMRNSPQAD